jgi:hypothetical protein
MVFSHPRAEGEEKLWIGEREPPGTTMGDFMHSGDRRPCDLPRIMAAQISTLSPIRKKILQL